MNTAENSRYLLELVRVKAPLCLEISLCLFTFFPSFSSLSDFFPLLYFCNISEPLLVTPINVSPLSVASTLDALRCRVHSVPRGPLPPMPACYLHSSQLPKPLQDIGSRTTYKAHPFLEELQTALLHYSHTHILPVI